MRVFQQWFSGAHREQRSTRSLRRQIELQNDLRLTLGSDSVCMPGWIPASSDQIDVVSPASWSTFFQRSSVDAILAEHVWEHLTCEEGKVAARNCFQFLRPGGYLRVAVPDGFHPSQDYIDQIRPGGSEVGAEGHQVLYNHLSFAEAFSNAGFLVRLIEYFDSDGVFHANHWDVSKGLIKRTLLFDERNVSQPYTYTSLVLDAFKPDAVAMGMTPTPLQALWEDIGDSGAEPSSTGMTPTPLQALWEDIGDSGAEPYSTDSDFPQQEAA
ncbi:MAG: methyltransferase domain-containing protein [Rubripirellula sp.]|nr:methyltransferase domain-containing protein [Rubripirellula sp.]